MGKKTSKKQRQKIVLPAEYQRTEQKWEICIYNKKKLKERSSCVEHFHIISEAAPFLHFVSASVGLNLFFLFQNLQEEEEMK